MPYVVDGDNLLGTWGRPRTDDEKRRLSLELDRFAKRAGKRVVTWFDGTEPETAGTSGNVRFSGRGRSADEAILHHLKSLPSARGWTVVTSDRSLADRCRWLEAGHERCHEFRRRLAPTPGTEKPEREDDVDYWLGQFGEAD